MTDTVRFAPSPTGLLHVGNARMALINGLFALSRGGRFLLRLDDTDAERSTKAFAGAIERDLRWLGLEWDGLARQSERMSAYHGAFEKLKGEGRLYACYETGEELEYKRKREMARGRPPLYDRAGLSLSGHDRKTFEDQGRQPHWRFKLEHADIAWDDLVRGPVHFHAEHLSDPVLVRGDGTFLYMLPSAVDDVDMGVTHVLRGEDHVANTAVQVQIFEALGATPPAFAHLPLLTDIAGGGLSKRMGSITLQSVREDGIEPMALNSYLARLGTSSGIRVCMDLGELAADFDIAAFGRGAPKFDPDQLRALNKDLLHALPFEAVADRLSGMGLENAGEGFWRAVRPNLERLEDARDWHEICFGDIAPPIGDGGFVKQAARLLPPEPWDETTWKDWTGAVRDATGRKGRELFMPLRQALTGLDHGPELKFLLPLMGRDRVLARLGG